jgi:parallel beta-helix repeat protein
MRRPAAFLPIALALGAIILAPVAAAREEGPIEIEKCQTISKPGSYKLVNNLAATGDCLVITADFVTIDLAGFLISGSGTGTGILTPASTPFNGLAVRNGSISGFDTGVNLDSAFTSIVEGLRVVQNGTGIVAHVIVRGNTVFNTTKGSGIVASASGVVTDNDVRDAAVNGIEAAGSVRGNTALGNRNFGIVTESGSTVIGNTANFNRVGIGATCPSNLTDNTAVRNIEANIQLFVVNPGDCHSEDNVAP